LLTGAVADWICEVAGRLACEECGCESRGRAEGWAAFVGEDPARIEPSCIGVFCPRCAGEVFDYRPHDGRDYT
jgi:hypothetical protein